MKSIDDFDLSQRTNTGGQTGSMRVRAKDDGAYYQYKPSILSNKMSRRMKAGWADRENFGEVIASSIGRALLSDDVVPEVSLVYDKENKRVAIASRYLEDACTLDDFAFETIGIHRSKDRSHVFVTSGVKSSFPSQLSLDEYPELPQSDICDSLALAAMVGDHDVNPGNLVVLGKSPPYRVARIDLGHAFGDLLNAPESIGGRLRHKEHPVLDFFNRTNVAGFRLGGDPSKLKRDYLGLVPSMEMVDSLRKMSQANHSRLALGVVTAREEFLSLINAMNENEDTAGLQHVRNSLAAIYQNLEGISPGKDLSIGQVVDLTFTAIHNSILANIEDAKKVANVMELQLEIDSAIKEGRSISERAEYLITEGNLPKDASGAILWVSVDNEPGFIGSLEEYNIYIVERNKENSPPQPSYRSFIEFKNKLKSISRVEQTQEEKIFFEQTSLAELRNNLLSYIEILETEQDMSIRFSGFRKEQKINAARALIDVLEGGKPQDLSKHLPVLENGRLGKTINDAIKPHQVRALVVAAEEGGIRRVNQSSPKRGCY